VRTPDQQLLDVFLLLEEGPLPQTKLHEKARLNSGDAREMLKKAISKGYLKYQRGLWTITEEGEKARAILAVARKHIDEVMK